MATKEKPESAGALFAATESFNVDLDGYPQVVKKGELVREGHELLRRFPHLFEPARARFEFGEVEQMTAAPGERRG